MQISWWTLAIQAVNFLVLVWLLKRFLYKPVQDVIEKRKEESLAASAEADRAKAAAIAKEEHYQKALSEIEQERKAVLEKARAEIESERNKVLEDANSSAAKIINDAKKAVEQEKSAARDGLKTETTELAVQLAKTMLGGLAKSVPNDVMLDVLEAELSNLPANEKRRLDKEIEADGAHVEIITPRDLTSREQKTWKSRIEKILDHPIEAKFASDPDIISGSVLRLPHTVIRATWADKLASAEEALKQGGDG